MIEADRRKAIYLLHQEGMSERAIARRLGVDRKTVRVIIEQKGVMPEICRPKQHIDEALLRKLYAECDGYAQRVHEKLTEEQGVEVTYPTLTRRLRELGISKPTKERCDRVPEEPGAEMQHDTTVYWIALAGKKVKLVASLVYMRFSKRRYLKFYRVFNRFKMKCFLHEAWMFWGYVALETIIDNTNLARLVGSGTGAAAVIVSEMEAFSRQYGTRFRCHAKGHANRKAGEERSFWTVETNFFPGRTFQSLEDLNRQAFEWSTVRMDNRPQGKVGLIPAKAFEFERRYLVKLPAHLPAPYRPHDRLTDQYGYVAFAGNYYWVPGTRRDDVKVLEYADRLKIYQARNCLIEYSLPANGVKNTLFSPPGQPAPRHYPNDRRKPTQQEERRLRAMAESVSAYLDFALKPKGIERHGFLRKLYALSGKMTEAVFVASIERAHKYRITDIATIERIAALNITQGPPSLPFAEVDEDFRARDTYREGRLTDAPDLSIYDQLIPGEDHD
jgi:transposase